MYISTHFSFGDELQKYPNPHISEMLQKNKVEQTIINLKAFPVDATCNGILQLSFM